MEAIHLVFVLILAFVCLKTVNSIEYSDLEAMGINCPNAVSCVFIDDSTRRNCECDRDCVIYQDCCFDATVNGTSRRIMNPAFTCMPFGREPGVGAYVIQTCSRNYNGPAAMQHKCQYQDNISDPLMAAPVTDTVTNTSYRNRYCAECNNVDLSNIRSWLIRMDCDLDVPAELGKSFIWQNLQYRPDMNKWGVDINNDFYTCYLNFELPAYLRTKTRLCRSRVVSTCPRKYSRMMVKRECESYTAFTYDRGDVYNTAYRNPHCAICNGVDVHAMSCHPGVVALWKPFSFPLLLDVNQSDGDVVGVSRPGGENCGSDQKYDPFFKKCRNLVCALPGYKMVNGKCKKTW